MDIKQNRVYNNTTMLKALEEVDKDKAVEAVSNPNLDRKELSEILECSMLGRIVYKDTNEPMKISNDVMIAGLRNLLNKIIQETNNT